MKRRAQYSRNLLFIICLICLALFTNTKNANSGELPLGTYEIKSLNMFASTLNIEVTGLNNANYFNIYKKSSSSLVNSTPVLIDNAINSMPKVYEDISDLEVWFYSDWAGVNKIAEFQLEALGELSLKTIQTAIGLTEQLGNTDEINNSAAENNSTSNSSQSADADNGGISTSNPIQTVNTQNSGNSASVFAKNNSGNGDAVVKITVDKLMLEKALSGASENKAGIKIVNIEINQGSNLQNYEINFPFHALCEDSLDKYIKIDTGQAVITLPSTLLNKEQKTDEYVSIHINMSYETRTTLGTKSLIQGRPVLNLKLSSGGKDILLDTGYASIKVEIPYQPSDNELAEKEKIIALYIDEEGQCMPMSNSRYDSMSQTVVFNIAQMGNYAAAFVNSRYNDLENVKWAKKSIDALAARGIIKGTTSEIFNPSTNITRADFVLLMIRTLDLKAEYENNFQDLVGNEYYYNAIGIAKKLGIAKGTGNDSFNPNENISRQDLFTLATTGLKLKGINLKGDTSQLARFSDKSKISDYAVESIKGLLNEGLLTGNENNTINPSGKATRAEAAVFMYRILYRIN